MTRQTILAALTLICLSHPRNRCAGADSQDTLEFLRLAHRAALQSIRSFQCEATIEEGTDKPELSVRAKYWRTADAIRVKEDYPDGRSEDILSKNSETVSVDRQVESSAKGTREQTSAGRRSVHDMLCNCDVWRHLLLNFPGRGAERCTLDEFLELPHSDCQAERLREGGRELIRLHFAYEMANKAPCKMDIWFDSRRNYLVSKMRVISGREEAVRQETDFDIVKFIEAAPAVYVPIECNVRVLYNGKPAAVMVTTLTNVRVNEPIPPDIFELPVPAGTVMADRIRGTTYIVDASGQPSGPSRSLTLEPPPLPNAEAKATGLPQATPVILGKQTAEESRAWTWWLAPVSFGILGTAGILWIVRTVRRSGSRV